MHDEDNDGRFPDESPAEVRYPRSKQEEHGDRERWPWLPGTIVEQCGPDEWYVCVVVRELAVLGDGRRAPRRTASGDLFFPCCFRDRDAYLAAYWCALHLSAAELAELLASDDPPGEDYLAKASG